MTFLITFWAVVSLASPPTGGPRLPASLDLDIVRSIVVQHDGRWMPLDTLARETIESVTGHEEFHGAESTLWLLAWTFDPDKWKNMPLVSISNAQLRAELGLPADQTMFSYTTLANDAQLRSLTGDLANISPGRKLNPLEAKVSDINGTLTLMRDVFGNALVRPIPDPDAASGTWQTIPETAPPDNAAIEPVVRAWDRLREIFLADDGPGFAKASSELAAALNALPAAYRPTPRQIETELHYNRLSPFRIAWIIMVVGAVLATIAALLGHGWARALSVIVMIAGFAVLTYGLSLRWTIAGRIPAANMFESLLFLSWGMGAFAIVSMILMRDRIVPLTASAMGALSLFLAETLPLDHFIRPIAPVLLDTIWMSIHVPVIMVSYSVLALAALIAHAQMIAMAAVPDRKKLAETIDVLHYWYVHVGCILLGAGIVTGSMWAASSWGRYWGWDPKEVWSLIAFLGYVAILHFRIHREQTPAWIYATGAAIGVAVLVIIMSRLAPLTGLALAGLLAAVAACVLFVVARGPFATALKSVVAFWLIIMTYVGVNFVLGIGLHSYGFGTGAVVRYMFLLGGIDMAFAAVCAAIYLLRRTTGGTAATLPATT